MRDVRGVCVVAAVVVLVSGCAVEDWSKDPDFCVNRDGNAFCASRGHDLLVCSLGVPGCGGYDSRYGDGCVAVEPKEACTSKCGGEPGVDEIPCLDGVGGSSGGAPAESSSGAWDTTTSEPVGGSQDGTGSDGSTGFGSEAGSTSMASSSGDDGTAGASDPFPYPPCEGLSNACPESFDMCYLNVPGFDFCTVSCQMDADCPDVEDGVTMVVPKCVGPGGAKFCVLDCEAGDSVCPPMMTCEVSPAFGTHRCVWPG